jgi:4-amino-4-deoxy-L-arabinose transferase-like glycosyltransferase
VSRPVLVAPSFPSSPLGDTVRGRLLVAGASWHETLSVGGLLLLIACGFLSRLPAVIISDMDEGTYLYAGKLLASGQAPYRDFLLAHPPLAVLLSGGWQWLFGSAVMPARIAYLVLTLASTISLYAIGRALARSHLAGLLAIAAYTTGMLLLANMGRTVRLEPLMNAFLLAGFAAYLLRPDSLRVRALVGALLAGAVLVKLVAVVPAGLLVIADACWARPGRRFLPSWLVAAGGAALVLVPSAVVLLSQPGFVDDVLRSQLNRPGLPLETKIGRAHV